MAEAKSREERVQDARARMAQYAAYRALAARLEEHPMWSAKDLADALRESGVLPNASRDRVQAWCMATLPNGERALPGAVDYSGNVGWRIPAEDLFIFFGEGFVGQLEKSEGAG